MAQDRTYGRMASDEGKTREELDLTGRKEGIARKMKKKVPNQAPSREKGKGMRYPMGDSFTTKGDGRGMPRPMWDKNHSEHSRGQRTPMSYRGGEDKRGMSTPMGK